MKPPALVFQRVSAAYTDLEVFTDISVTIDPGTFTGIVGPNGSGKSTFINAALGLVKQVRGEVRFFGQKLSQVRHQISYVPQKDGIDMDFPISVWEVVKMGRLRHGNLWKAFSVQDKQMAQQALEMVDMWEFRNRQIGALSGGQRQRVFLARALAGDASLVFLDESFSGVDAVSESKIMDVLRLLNRQGKTIVMVHHDLNSVKDYFSHVLLMNKGLVAYGTTEETFTAPNLALTYGGNLPMFASKETFS